MKRAKAVPFIFSCLLLLAAVSACGKDTAEESRTESQTIEDIASEDFTETEPDSSEETEMTSSEPSSETETESDESSEEESGTEDLSSDIESSDTEDPASDTESEPDSTEESSSGEPSEPEGMVRFFGRYTDERIAAVNEKTLSDPGSKLFDLTEEYSCTAQEILELIESYVFPERSFYDGIELTDSLREEFLAGRNLETLQKLASEKPEEPLLPRYGIFTENSNVRSFPTEVTARDGNDEHAFDWFQETMLPLGSGALVLHESADGRWYFVRGYNYSGWVLSETLGLTEREQFLEYLSPDRFAVFCTPDYSIKDKKIRMGSIFPEIDSPGENDEKYMHLAFPERTETGELLISDVRIRKQPALISEGFLPYSEEALLLTAEKMLNQSYGWGDTDGHYDCSSTAGLIYQCFGIFLPRNTSDMPHYGGPVLDLSALSDEEKLPLLEAHPGAVVLLPGHAVILETDPESGGVVLLHNLTSYYREDGTLESPYHAVRTMLSETYYSDGRTALSLMHTLLWYGEETVPSEPDSPETEETKQ